TGRDRSPRKPRGGRSRRWRDRASDAKATRGQATSVITGRFLVGREPAERCRPSRDGRRRPSRLLAFPVVVGILPLPRPATGAHLAREPGVVRHTPSVVPRLARPIPHI